MSYTSSVSYTSHNTTPRSPAEFAKRWDIPDAAGLIEGNEYFADMYARQNKLVGKVLDACIILHVNERLKNNARIENLSFFFPKRLTAHETAVLKGEVPNMTPEQADAARLELLVKMSQESGPLRKLKSHRDLVSDRAWNDYKFQIEFYKDEKAKGHLLPPVPPEDPRISAISERISGTIEILNPGPKSPGAIEGKMERKKVSAQDLLDINRIGVLPVSPQYAKDFIKIMGMLNPKKTITNPVSGEISVPRMYEELPKVFSNGYCDQKIFMAMDQQRDNKGPTKDTEATIAEVKIVPAAMDKAAELSAIIKPLWEQCMKGTYYSSDAKSKNVTNTIIDGRRRQLEEFYQSKKSDFDRLNSQFKTDYKLPAFPTKNMHRTDTYITFAKQLLDLSRRIHVDAILSESREWQLEYLNTAVFQRLCQHEAEFKARTESTLPVEIKKEEQLDPQSIERIVKAGKFDLKEIERDIKSKLPPSYVKPAAIG